MTILQEALAKMLKPLQWRNDGNGDRYGRAAGTETGSRGASVYLTDEPIHAGELLEHLLDDVIPVVDPLPLLCNKLQSLSIASRRAAAVSAPDWKAFTAQDSDMPTPGFTLPGTTPSGYSSDSETLDSRRYRVAVREGPRSSPENRRGFRLEYMSE